MRQSEPRKSPNDDRGENVTGVYAVSASGFCAPPMMIYQTKMK
jgi:hypothetical protein